jgi:hypothetical protein
LVSVKDIERIAATSTTPVEKAAAAWLLEHREVLGAIDQADSRFNATDNKISRGDIQRFRQQRAAFQVLNDNFSEFDGAQTIQADGTVTLDGKVSREDIEKVARTSKNQTIKEAAEYLLKDERALNLNISSGDELIGKYEVQAVATKTGEPIVPLKIQTNWVRTVGCTAAGELSVLSYVDLLEAGNDGKDAFAAGRSAAYTVSLKKLATESSKAAVAKTAAMLGSWQVTAGATAIDLACRATAPRTDWGTVRSGEKKKGEEPSGPPSTPQAMAKK